MANYWSLPVEEQAHTYEEIASSWSLWEKYVDPGATQTEKEFDAMTIQERISFMERCFGPEEKEDEGCDD